MTSSPSDGTALLLCGRHESAGLTDLAHALRRQYPGLAVDTTELNAGPDEWNGIIETFGSGGSDTVIVAPAFLSDSPEIKAALADQVTQARDAFPDLTITLARELAIDAQLLRAAQARIADVEALADAAGDAPARAETVLVVAGRGSADPDLNSNLFKVTRLLWEGLGFGWAEAAFLEGTAPDLDTVLAKVERLGFKRTVVFPYLLLDDPLAAALEDVRSGGTPVLTAGSLNQVADLVPCFQARLEEAVSGPLVMNCQLCTYREQVLGREARERDTSDADHSVAASRPG